MAKRSVTSEMSSDSKLALIAENNPTAALMWPWFITHLDDWGRFTADPIEIKLRVFPAFPYTHDEIKEAVILYDKYGLAHYYEVDGKSYIAVNPDTFYKYQSYIGEKRKEKDTSKYPPPPNPPWKDKQTSEPISDVQRNTANICEPLKSSDNFLLSLSHSHSHTEKDYSLQHSVATTTDNSFQEDVANKKEGDKPDKSCESLEETKYSTGNKKIFSESSVEYELALLLRQEILKNLPSARVPRASPDGLEKWCIDIDRMIRLDKRDPDDIASVIRWAQSDSFWRSNILSAKKLREKWETLVLQSQREKGEITGEKHASPIVTQTGEEQGKYSSLIPTYGDTS